MSHVCRTCDEIFLKIPEDAVLIAPSRRGRFSSLWRFADGSIHDLRLRRDIEPPVIPQEKSPEPPKEEPPAPESQEVVEVLEQVPEPPKPEVTEPEIENDDAESSAPMTPMRMAFERLFEKPLRSGKGE